MSSWIMYLCVHVIINTYWSNFLCVFLKSFGIYIYMIFRWLIGYFFECSDLFFHIERALIFVITKIYLIRDILYFIPVGNVVPKSGTHIVWPRIRPFDMYRVFLLFVIILNSNISGSCQSIPMILVLNYFPYIRIL